MGRAGAVVPGCAPTRRWCATGATQAIVRAEVVDDDRRAALRGRDPRGGPQPGAVQQAGRSRARVISHGLLRVTVFAPDDLELVKGGPAQRRDYLDELLGDARGRVRRRARRLRTGAEATQRAAAVRRARRRRPQRRSTCSTSSWCTRGAELVRGRLRLVDGWCPAVDAAYDALAGRDAARSAERTKRSGRRSRSAIARRRRRRRTRCARRSSRAAGREIDRGLTLVGPHRDELAAHDRRARRAHAGVAGRAAHARARRCASPATSGRTSSPARRRCCCSTTCSASSTRARADALVRNLPPGQTLLTTAGVVPAGRRARTRVLRIARPAVRVSVERVSRDT